MTVAGNSIGKYMVTLWYGKAGKQFILKLLVLKVITV